MAGGDWTYGYYWNNDNDSNEDGYESGYIRLLFCTKVQMYKIKSLQFFSFNILFHLEIVTL